jgi:DNA-binding CsgD family transcriptional regulator
MSGSTMAVMDKTSLSASEREIVRLISEGMDTEDIAEEMFLSRYTVKAKIKRIRAFVGGGRMTELPALVEQMEKG